MQPAGRDEFRNSRRFASASSIAYMETVAGASNLRGDVITGRLAHHCYGGRAIAIQYNYAVGAVRIRALFDLFLLESTWSFYAPWALVRRSCCTIVWQLPTF